MSASAFHRQDAGAGVSAADPVASARAVIWASGGGAEAPAAPGVLVELLRARGLDAEPVQSAPAALLAVLRPGPPAAAIILVEPMRLQRACEAVAVLERHAPGVRCWRFEPPPAGPGGAGVLERVVGPLRLDLPIGNVHTEEADPETPEPAHGEERGRIRLSREELAMLLGPTRTLGAAAGGGSGGVG